MFQNHPRGLWYIFFTEMWERFGFYILMAVLVLYMDQEFGWPDSRKGDFYGWFLGAVYFFPLIGGWIGDRLLGQIRSIRTGALIMIAGYISLALSAPQRLYFFYLGLALIAFGTGIFKVNMSVLVGNLYSQREELKDAGFNIYYMGVNLGAAIAPLAATALSIAFHSYRISFWAAAAGLLFCLLVLQSGKKYLQDYDLRHTDESHNSTGPVRISPREERERIITLITLFVIVIFFWVAFYQNGFALTLFAERSTIRLNFLRPETYQFFNPFFILVLTPLLVGFFGRLREKGKEPSTPQKIFLGMLVMGASMLVMVVASLLGGDRDVNIMSPLWLITTYLIVTLAELLISPMGQSFVSKVAPPRFRGVMMGGWFVATALGSYGSGLLGKFYSDFAHHQYFLILTALLMVSVVLVRLFMKRLEQFAVN